MTIRELSTPRYEMSLNESDGFYNIQIGKELPKIFCIIKDSMAISTTTLDAGGIQIEGYAIKHNDFELLDGYYYVLSNDRLNTARESVVLISEGPNTPHVPYKDLVNTIITTFPQFLGKLEQNDSSVGKEIAEHLKRLQITKLKAPTLLKYIQVELGKDLEMNDLLNLQFPLDNILKFFRGRHDAIFTYDGIDYVRINDLASWWKIDFRYNGYEGRTFRDNNGYILSPKGEFMFFRIDDNGEIVHRYSRSAAFNSLLANINKLEICESIKDLAKLNLSHEEYSTLARLDIFNFERKVLRKRKFSKVIKDLKFLKSKQSNSEEFQNLVQSFLSRIYEQPLTHEVPEFLQKYFGKAEYITSTDDFFRTHEEGIHYLKNFHRNSLSYYEWEDLRGFYNNLVMRIS